MRVYQLLKNIGGLVAGDEVVVVLAGATQVRVQRRADYASNSGMWMAFVQRGDLATTLQPVDGTNEPARIDDAGAVDRDNQAFAMISGGSGPSASPDVGSLLQSVVDHRASLMSTAPSTTGATTGCGSMVPTVWEPSTDDLVAPITICTGVTVALGHSFAQMADRERYLREASGVYATSSSVDGPNNALGEIRLMLATARCRAIQVAIRFTDTSRRHLLFRSTAGHVLIFNEARVPVVRTHATVSALTNDGYAREETFVHAGAHSFFVQDLGAADEPRLQTPELYAAHHAGTYRGLVGGVDNAQQFHHSEQAFFKLLYDYPNAVSDAIDFVLQDFLTTPGLLQPPLSQPLRLCAISVDVYTTRAACAGCLASSQAVQTAAQHFFAVAIKDVGMRTHPMTLQVDPGIRKLVRIACARPFTGTPSGSSVKSTPLGGDGTYHALPADPIAVRAVDEPPIFYRILQVPVNHESARPLLRTGTERTEVTWVDRALRAVRELDSSLSTPVAAWWSKFYSKEKTLPDGILLAAELMRLDERVHKRVHHKFDASDVNCFTLDRIRFAVQQVRAFAGGQFAEVFPFFVVGVLRYFHALFDDDPYFPWKKNYTGRFDGVFFVKVIRVALTQPELGETEPDPLLVGAAEFLAKNTQAAIQRTLDLVAEEIQANLDEQTATGENRALNLAIEFGLVEEFQARRPRWGATSGSSLDSVPFVPVEVRARPTAVGFLIDQGVPGAVDTFNAWLATNRFREGAATGAGHNCALHTFHQFGNGATTFEGQAGTDYPGMRARYGWAPGSTIELGTLTAIVDDRHLCVYVYTLNTNGTVSPAGVFGTPNDTGTNVRHMLHVGLHYEPLWPAG